MCARDTTRSTSKCTLLLSIACFVAATNCKAGRPLAIDDATPVAMGEFEMEAGISYFDDGPLRHWDFPLGLAYGVTAGWEIGVASGGQLEERAELESGDPLVTGFSDVIVGTKLKLASQENLWADQAVSFSTKLPTDGRGKGLSTGEVDYDLTWIASRRLGDRMSFHLNVGYTWLTDPPDERFDNVIHYGVALTRRFSDKIEFAAEVFANTSSGTDVFVNGGFRWQWAPNLVWDAAIGAGVRGETPDIIATFGLTWSFSFKRH